MLCCNVASHWDPVRNNNGLRHLVLVSAAQILSSLRRMCSYGQSICFLWLITTETWRFLLQNIINLQTSYLKFIHRRLKMVISFGERDVFFWPCNWKVLKSNVRFWNKTAANVCYDSLHNCCYSYCLFLVAAIKETSPTTISPQL